MKYKLKNKYRCESVRLCRYRQGPGLDKESIQYKGKEVWLFEKSNELQESLDFFFSMRKKLKDKRIIKGANENDKTNNEKMDKRRR